MNKSVSVLVLLGAVLSTAHADNLTIPNVFSPNTPAIAAEVNENFAAVESSVDDNDARITGLEGGANYGLSGFLNDFSSNLTSTYSLVATRDTFTKQEDDTRLELYLHSRIRSGVFGSGATGVLVELRVDDSPASLTIRGAVTVSNTIDFVSGFAVFEGLPAGQHTFSLWARTNNGVSTGFLPDPGGWGGRILVKEVR